MSGAIAERTRFRAYVMLALLSTTTIYPIFGNWAWGGLFDGSPGWLEAAEIVPSPNFDSRPDEARIRLIVVHGISLPPGEYGGGHIQRFFCNRLDAGAHEYFASICDMRVSAHCLVERSGKIVQFARPPSARGG